MTGRPHWVLWGCAAWTLGCVGFFISAIRSGDGFGVVSSLLFTVGIALFAIPELKN